MIQLLFVTESPGSIKPVSIAPEEEIGCLPDFTTHIKHKKQKTTLTVYSKNETTITKTTIKSCKTLKAIKQQNETELHNYNKQLLHKMQSVSMTKYHSV